MRIGLPDNHGLSDLVLETPELLPQADGQHEITDAQYAALEAGIARGQSVLISAPTSTGKTLIGWWTIESAVRSGARAVYLVSHRALAKQKFEEARRLFLDTWLAGDPTALVCATGDGVEDASGRKTNHPLGATILVATYEKFLGCLSVGGPPRDLTNTCFVCDEVQLIGDQNRGRNVELLLTLLRRSGWRQMVCLSAVMGEADGQSLADWLELKAVRCPSREKDIHIECRTPSHALHVSASRERVGDIEKTERQKERRTLNIVKELLDENAGPVIAFCMKVDDTFDHCKEWIGGRRHLLDVTPPPGIDLDQGLKEALERRAAFHNAELSEDERIFVETRLASGEVDVVFATSTLAAGVNFPLGSAVFASWKRWNFDRREHVPISRAEFQNMAGRVGRMGQAATTGQVIMCAEGVGSETHAKPLMDLAAQDELGSGISPQDFGAVALQVFAGRLCESREGAFGLIESTLSASREASSGRGDVEHWRPSLDSQIDRLLAAGCLVESRSVVSATAFGIAVARTGLKPETALYFIENMSIYGDRLLELLPKEGRAGDEDGLLFVLAHGALTSPEYTLTGGAQSRQINWRVGRTPVGNPYARRLDDQLWLKPWISDVSAANAALLIAEWASGRQRTDIEAAVPGVRIGTVENIARDVAWILTGVSEVIAEVSSPILADEAKPPALRGNRPEVSAIRNLARGLRRNATRVAAGLPSDVLWMTSLELQGARRRLSRSQMLGLRHQGLTRPHDLMDGAPEADQRRQLALPQTGGGERLSNTVRDAAKNWKRSEREHILKQHLKRAAKIGERDIVERLHKGKEMDLEEAFSLSMRSLSINCTKLDDTGKQAHPDFMISIEDYPDVVVEIKSKQRDDAFVSLNSATEVLVASELIGMKTNFCVTLCSPGAEPSVPSFVEGCGRLCVLEVADLAEAFLRLKEGTLTRNGFYNWLTTPGIALREDLPHPT